MRRRCATTLRRSIGAAWLLCAALACPLLAQDKDAGKDKAPPLAGKGKEEDEVARMKVDPYTGGDLALLQQAGHSAYGPFLWSKDTRTEDIDRVLGEGRVLWLETAHFRIGCNLRTVPIPEKQAQRKAIHDEVAALRKKLPKIPDKPKRLDPWLRMHLYAARAEKLYAEFESLLLAGGATFGTAKEPPNGPYLGLPDKHLLLIFQKKSDLARYFDRFCGVHADRSFSYYLPASHQMLFGVSLEGLEVEDDPSLHSHVLYGLAGNLCNGLRGYSYRMPPWLSEGFAHLVSRRVETEFVNVTIKDDEAVNEEEQHLWPKKVRARAQYDRTRISFAQMALWQSNKDMGYHGELQSWSRVDFLHKQDKDKLGALLLRLKSLPISYEGVKPEDWATMQQKAVEETFGWDAATFDAKWRDFVLATYPKK